MDQIIVFRRFRYRYRNLQQRPSPLLSDRLCQFRNPERYLQPRLPDLDGSEDLDIVAGHNIQVVDNSPYHHDDDVYNALCDVHGRRQMRMRPLKTRVQPQLIELLKVIFS